jgi:hypothetical protein
VNGPQRLRRALTLLLALGIAGCIEFEAVPPPGPPTQLAFFEQPPGAVAGAAFIPAVRVAVEDANGVVVNTGGPWDIVLTIGDNPGGGTLSGEVLGRTAQGIAIFGNLSINQPGVGYTLVATATGFPAKTSDPFTITAP